MYKFIKFITLALSLTVASVLAGETPQISQQKLLESLKVANNNIVILDVRSEDEYNQGHLIGAINISHKNIKAHINQLEQYKDSKVVVYCRSGRRAGIAEEILSANGFKDLHHLTGDMNGWLKAKLPVVQRQP